MTTRAAIYTRISRDSTKQGAGVDRQRRDCQRLCKQRGWNVAHTFVENDTSASTTKPRPQYQAMLAAIRAGEVDAVVAYHVDRLTRRLVELEELIVLAEQHSVIVATATGDLDLSNDSGRLVGRILASVARGEVERKARRQKDAGRSRAEGGRPPARRAYGYTADGMRPLEPEASIVREMYERVLTGSTLVGLARDLNDRGITNTRGGAWQRNAIRNLLLNPRYMGRRLYRGEDMGRGVWEPLVTEETWQAARAILTDGVRVSNTVGTARKWLGSGLFLCGRCPDDDRSDMKVNYREGGVRVYRCRAHLHMARQADEVDEYVSAVVVARLRRPDLADLLAVQDDHDGPSVVDLRREAETLRRRMDSLAVELADGVLTPKQVQAATRRLESKLEGVESQLAAAGQRSAVDAMLSTPDPGQAWLDADLDRKRAVVDALATIVLWPGASGRHEFDPASVLVDWR